MIEQRSFPFGGVPVYNPQSLSKDEALAQFHVRQPAYEHLMALLRQERPPHVLIIGTRGMGKTTLLQRVRYGVEDEFELNRRYLVLLFPEEQYNVNRLHRFLLNTVDAVADAMERLHDKQAVRRIESYAGSLSKKPPEEVEEEVPRFLAEVANEIHRDFLLLVDNADRLFEMIEEKQQWRLRDLLSSRKDLTFFGATTQASDGIYGSDRAFFEFFQVQTLPPLTAAEVRGLLLKLSEAVEEKEGEQGAAKRRVHEWLDADASRLRTLVQLTGGNPRTAVLLFHLVLDGLKGGAREYLEQLLDQVTPTYKGRVDELSPQAQQVLDAVALHWDPVTAMEVASESGLETGVASTQLTRLVRQGILEKADPGDSKKALYQVAERFFNIWYLMRASRRVRTKLRWFVEFLRVFFDNGELERIAWDRIERTRPTWRSHPEEVETVFAYAIASGTKRDRLEEYLRDNCPETEEVWRPYLEMMERVAGQQVCPPHKESILTEADNRALIGSEPRNAVHWGNLGDLLNRDPDRAAEAEAAYRKAIELDPKSARYWHGLGMLLRMTPERAAEAEVAYRKAIELDPKSARYWQGLGLLLAQTPERAAEAEAAYRNGIELDSKQAGSWHGLGRLLATIPKREAEAEAAYRKAIELNPKEDVYWQGLGSLLAQTPERASEAEVAYREAIELDPKWAGYWQGLGLLLAQTPERASAAEAAYRKGIELDPRQAGSWHGLGRLLATIPKREAEAEAAYRKAIELNPKEDVYWQGLGSLIAQTPERASEAEAAYREAIELDPKLAVFWYGLGNLLERIPERQAEAEAAYRKAIELEPKWVGFWHSLGLLLANTPERVAEAETVFREAIELDSKSHGLWHDLGTLLADAPERAAEAEAAYRNANELEPECVGRWRALGFLLAKTPERVSEAETAFRKAIELDPRSALSWHHLGILLAKTPERASEAEAAFRKAIKLDPRLDGLWHDLGALLERSPERVAEAEAAFRKAIELDPKEVWSWYHLGHLLAEAPERTTEAEAAYRAATAVNPEDAQAWGNLGFFLACQAHKPRDAEAAFRTALRIQPNHAKAMCNLGVLLYCELDDVSGGIDCLERAHQLDAEDPIIAAIAVAARRSVEHLVRCDFAVDAAHGNEFWNQLLERCSNYPPFGKLLLAICDLVEDLDATNPFVQLYRAVAFGQLGEFPRASVAFEDALLGDPIEMIAIGQQAIETILAAAVRNRRVLEFIDVLDKKDWKDAWRPIYEALRAVETGSAEYLKRIAVEFRVPALDILRRVAPHLRDMPRRQDDR